VPDLRVVVTGVGVVSSIGSSAPAFLQGLLHGTSGASVVRAFDTHKFPSHIGCEVPDFDATRWVHRLRIDALGRSSRMAIAAARQAVADSGIGLDALRALRCDVVMGTTDGEAAVFDEFASAWLHRDGDAPPALPQLQTAEVIADSVQEELELQGESAVIATACSAGNYAIGYAIDKLRDGTADAVLCGGSDAQCLKNFGGFYRIGALAPEKCQPFDRDRKGILPGEGAAVLLLEPLAHALARRAPIYAEVLGYGASCDGHHIMSPHEDGIVACARDALQRCGLQPQDVDYISAHGTATAANDVIETAAMRAVFGAHLPPMSSMKSMLGHTMGAASALAAVGCVLALKHGFMPPTINFTQPDPACAIDCVPNRARSAALDVVQNNAFAFGGNNAIVLFRRYSS
jgi:3-oxoacyl-[acyl-carrier-protein] synthase II